MRLGLVVYGDLDYISGGFLYDRKLVEYLKKSGDDVEIISIEWKRYSLNIFDNLSSKLSKHMQNGRYDVLLEDELNHSSLFILNRKLKKECNFPIISIVHHLKSSERGPKWRNFFYRTIERSYLNSVDGFIFNSQTTRNSAIENCPDIKNFPNIVAYPAGDHLDPAIKEEEIIHRADEKGPLRVLFVGNLIPRKGLHDLIEAIRNLPRGGILLTIAGDPSIDPGYFRKLKNQVKRLNLQDFVRFSGFVQEKSLRILYRSHHVLAVPSSYEGYGIVYLEGMGYGLPAIGTTSGAASDIITHNKDGFLITAGDVNALAGHLETVSNNRHKLREMALEAYQHFHRQPGWEQNDRKIREFLVENIKNHENP